MRSKLVAGLHCWIVAGGVWPGEMDWMDQRESDSHRIILTIEFGGVSSITQQLTWKFWQVEVTAMWQEPREMDAFNLGNEELTILGEQEER